MAMFSEISTVGLATLVLLLVCSIIVVAIVFERIFFFRQNVIDAEWLHSQVALFLSNGNVQEAAYFVSQVGGLLPRVYEVGLQRYHLPQEASDIAMSNSISAQRLLLERFLPIIGTIAVIAPFIGLFGTVVGIMHTFSAVAQKGQAGVAVVAAGVAEALVATAAGLFVAITAVVFFNYFKSKVAAVTSQMAGAAGRLSEMMEMLRTGKPFPEDLLTFSAGRR
jgi:biopolymer transport protein ExbB/TolQ